MSERLQADVCVVGAGAGGAVVAAELAEGGASVIVLDAGPAPRCRRLHRPPAGDARAAVPRRRPDRDARARRRSCCRSGSGLGGTTLVNSGTCFRTPPEVLDRWGREFGLELDEATLRPCFERVERALSVAEVTPELAGANAAVARRGAERLGWSHGYLRRNARGCVGSGVCVFGCPTSAKQHTGITYMPRAEAAGARIVTGAEVRQVRVERGPRARRARAASPRSRRWR